MAGDDTLEILIKTRGGKVAAAEIRGVTKETKGLSDATDRQDAAQARAASSGRGLASSWAGLLARGTAMGAMLATVTAGLVGVVGIKFNATMESNTVAFTNFLGTTAKAEKHLNQLYKLSATTPFEFADVVNASRRLLAFGQSAEESNKWLRTIGDTVAGIGGGTEEINRMVGAIGQIQAKGKASTEEMLQLAELGIPAFEALAKGTGRTTKQVFDDLADGAISSKEALGALQGYLGKQFGGASAEQAKTFNGQLSTLKDNATQFAGVLSKPVFNWLKDTFLPAASKGMERLQKAFKARGASGVLTELERMAGTGGKVRAAIGWVVKAVRNLWGIGKQLYDDVLKPVAPLVAGAVLTGFRLLGGTLGFVNKHLGTILLIVAPFFAAWAAGAIVIAVVNGALGLMIGALGILNAVLALNPVVLVVAALVGLGVALVIAYKKVGWFRSAVQTVWGWIKKNWPLILGFLTGPLGLAVVLIVKHWGKIKSAAGSALGWIRDRFNGFVGFIKGVPGKLGSAAGDMFGWLKGAFRDAYNFVAGGWNSLRLTFELPGILKKLPGPDTVTIGTPRIPMLAEGGTIAQRGAAVVGDEGPELLDLPEGARVTPLDGASGPVRERLRLLTVEGRVLAEAVFGAAEDAEARA